MVGKSPQQELEAAIQHTPTSRKQRAMNVHLSLASPFHTVPDPHSGNGPAHNSDGLPYKNEFNQDTLYDRLSQRLTFK